MINQIDIKVTQLLNDLNAGMTWLKRDDLGYGSVEEKYKATEAQVGIIRKHPLLKDAETNATVINIIDDTENGSGTEVKAVDNSKKAEIPVSTDTTAVDSNAKNESAEAFNNI